ncbi:hypothetical protein Pelo_3370 [Pelomyxa schiedti]|nr:hypothetical protein Pelo_3370 [Pelomyxa schiedti]
MQQEAVCAAMDGANGVVNTAYMVTADLEEAYAALRDVFPYSGFIPSATSYSSKNNERAAALRRSLISVLNVGQQCQTDSTATTSAAGAGSTGLWDETRVESVFRVVLNSWGNLLQLTGTIYTTEDNTLEHKFTMPEGPGGTRLSLALLFHVSFPLHFELKRYGESSTGVKRAFHAYESSYTIIEDVEPGDYVLLCTEEHSPCEGHVFCVGGVAIDRAKYNVLKQAVEVQKENLSVLSNNQHQKTKTAEANFISQGLGNLLDLQTYHLRLLCEAKIWNNKALTDLMKSAAPPYSLPEHFERLFQGTTSCEFSIHEQGYNETKEVITLRKDGTCRYTSETYSWSQMDERNRSSNRLIIEGVWAASIPKATVSSETTTGGEQPQAQNQQPLGVADISLTLCTYVFRSGAHDAVVEHPSGLGQLSCKLIEPAATCTCGSTFLTDDIEAIEGGTSQCHTHKQYVLWTSCRLNARRRTVFTWNPLTTPQSEATTATPQEVIAPTSTTATVSSAVPISNNSHSAGIPSVGLNWDDSKSMLDWILSPFLYMPVMPWWAHLVLRSRDQYGVIFEMPGTLYQWLPQYNPPSQTDNPQGNQV